MRIKCAIFVVGLISIKCDFLCSSRSQPAGCDGVCTVHYRTYDRTYEFSARNGPNREAQFFATAFLDENRSNRKNNQTNTNRMMGWIENRPNKFLNQNFVCQTLPPKQSMSPFNFTSLKYAYITWVCNITSSYR